MERVHEVLLQTPVPGRPLLLLPRAHDLGGLLAPVKLGIDHVVGQQDVAHVSLGLRAIEQHDVVPAERLVAPPAAEDGLGRDDVRRAAASEHTRMGIDARHDRAAHVHVLEEIGHVVFAESDLAASLSARSKRERDGQLAGDATLEADQVLPEPRVQLPADSGPVQIA